MVPFSGYDMPVQYSGLIKEHDAVRKHAGLFDVSHMGVATFEGPRALEFLQRALTRDLAPIAVGAGAYTLACFESGGTVDDLIVYRKADHTYVAVLNAGNKEKDLAHFRGLAEQWGYSDVSLRDHFREKSLLALQGPKVFALLKTLGLQRELSAATNFSYFATELAGIPVEIAQTGYTGERGVEIVVDNSQAATLWNKILEVGAPEGVLPCGLGARDTLRMEMGYSLYGHELTGHISPVEAGLSWAIGWGKTHFLGKAALEEQKKNPERKLVSLKNTGRQAARAEMKVFDAHGTEVGVVTSGTFAPSLGFVIAMALVSTTAQPPYSIQIRTEKVPFETSRRPFYKKES